MMLGTGLEHAVVVAWMDSLGVRHVEALAPFEISRGGDTNRWTGSLTAEKLIAMVEDGEE